MTSPPPPDRTGEVWTIYNRLFLIIGKPINSPTDDDALWRHPVVCLEPGDDAGWDLTHVYEKKDVPWTSMSNRKQW